MESDLNSTKEHRANAEQPDRRHTDPFTNDQRLETCVSNSPLAIVELDPELRIIGWEGAAEKMFGWKVEEILGKTAAEMRWVHEDDTERVGKEFADLICGKNPSHVFVSQNYCKNGSSIWCQWFNSVVFDADGRPASILSQVLDITAQEESAHEVKRLSDELQTAVSRFEDSNRELEAFNYSIAHELRGPLAAIDGFSTTLLTHYEDQLDDKSRQFVRLIRDNTHKLGCLIDELLELSRMGTQEMKVGAIDMGTLFEKQFRELRDFFPERQIEFEMSLLPPAAGDETLIGQVIHNLLSNALKFTRQREVAEIKVDGRIDDHGYYYCVEDNGVGFQMKHVEKAFDVFQRLHAEEEFEGTGVGLAVVRHIVLRHGGDVWAEAEPDKGAKFCFFLPFQKKRD